MLFTFKNNTDIPHKFLKCTVGKFWSKVAEHPGLYIKQADINSKSVPLILLVPEEILACILSFFRFSMPKFQFVSQKDPESEEEEEEEESGSDDPDSSPPKKTTRKRKAPKSSSSTKNNQRNVKVKKESKENYDMQSVKQEPYEGTIRKHELLEFPLVYCIMLSIRYSR